ncbi:MAG: ABC transporter ATP-binding protein [Aristaeellaceae bacterium]
MSKQKNTLNAATLRRVLPYIRPYRLQMLLSLLCASVSAAAALLIPIFSGNAIDCMIGRDEVDFGGILMNVVFIAVTALLAAIAQQVLATSNNRIAYCVSRDIRNETSRKLQRLPLSYLDQHPTGDLVSRVIADVDAFSDGLLMGFTQLFTGVVTIAGTLGIMLALNWTIAALVVVLTPLSLFVAAFIAKNTHRFFTAQSVVRGEQTAMINEMIEGQKVIQAFGHEAESLAEFDRVNEELGSVALKATFFSSLVNPSTRLVNNIIYAAVAFVCALLAIGTNPAMTMTVGGMSKFLSYASQYAKPFNEISGVVTELQNALACIRRIFDLLDQPDRVPDKADAAGLTAQGHVSMQDVSFRYVPDRPLIEGFTLDVQPGQRIAIVGPTGCGKTTLINLLMRFYDVDGGVIRVDGTDIRDIRRHELRRNIGMVLQDTWLKAGTIRENIAYGRPDAPLEEVIAAAKAAHAHSFIRRLPDGYDTPITENGGNLSQGQKQLLCIARVMLTLPPMLILDEATSSIDTRTELRIQSAFARMMQGRTSFIVAHRLSTIREADVILVMKDGHIIEQGNHDALMAQNGFYTTLYNAQFGL